MGKLEFRPPRPLAALKSLRTLLATDTRRWKLLLA